MLLALLVIKKLLSLSLSLLCYFSRTQRLRFGVCAAVYSKEIQLERRSFFTLESPSIVYNDKCEAAPRFHEISSVMSKRALSSNAGTKSDQEDDLEDGFSELENSKKTSSSSDDSEDDEVTPEGKLSADEENDTEEEEEEVELDLIGTDDSRQTVEKKPSELFKTIVSAAGLSVGSALDKWVENGNEISRAEASKAMIQLRRRRMYGRALQVNFSSFE